jgi:hypothetical protein
MGQFIKELGPLYTLVREGGGPMTMEILWELLKLVQRLSHGKFNDYFKCGSGLLCLVSRANRHVWGTLTLLEWNQNWLAFVIILFSNLKNLNNFF